MTLNILYFSTEEIRHEPACAAVLQTLGYNVIYIRLNNSWNKWRFYRWNILTDNNRRVCLYTIDVPTSMFSSIILNTWLKTIFMKLLDEYNIDLMISTQGIPWRISRSIREINRIPLILRVWGIRAIKSDDYIRYAGEIRDAFLSPLSLAYNSYQILSSSIVTSLDDYTSGFINRFKKCITIYPSYALTQINTNTKGEYRNTMDKILDIIERINYNYIFSIVTLSRPNFKIELPLIKILLHIAIKNPWINVVIIGSNSNEIKARMRIQTIPKNLIALGKIHNDKTISYLYRYATLVVLPIFFKSVSNRLIEALFYGKPILTNSYALLLHRKLKNNYHIYVCDNYASYPLVVASLLKKDYKLIELGKRAQEAYRKYFSSEVLKTKLKYLINKVIDN